MRCTVYIIGFIGAIASNNAAFRQGTGPILLNNVHCLGLEQKLLDCVHGGVGVEIEGCVHQQEEWSV